jgi:hypothetical protein
MAQRRDHFIRAGVDLVAFTRQVADRVLFSGLFIYVRAPFFRLTFGTGSADVVASTTRARRGCKTIGRSARTSK